MKRIFLTLAIAATILSCSTDDTIINEPQAGFTIGFYDLVSVDFETPTGNATDTYDRCFDTWHFQDGILTRQKYNRESCEHMYQTENTYRVENDSLYIGEGAHSFQLTESNLTIKRVTNTASWTYNLVSKF